MKFQTKRVVNSGSLANACRVEKVVNKRFIGIFHQQFLLDLDPTPLSNNFFDLDGIVALFFVFFPVQSYSSTLPVRQLIEIDTMLKKQLIFEAN